MKPRPGSPHARADYTYYPPISHIPSDASPMLSGRAWTITADVITGDGIVEGVIYSRGSHNIGQTFFIKDGVLNFDYNALSKHTRVASPVSLSAGQHQIAA
ncbi:MAG: arylsulfatase, partial [Actinomycetota bacterium]